MIQDVQKPPEPRPLAVKRKFDPKSMRAQMQTALRQNWENSDPKYWAWRSNHRYRFLLSELEEMAEQISPEERKALFRLLDEACTGKFETARILRMPMALVEYLIIERERQNAWEEAYEEQLEREYLIEQILEDVGLVLDS